MMYNTPSFIERRRFAGTYVLVQRAFILSVFLAASVAVMGAQSNFTSDTSAGAMPQSSAQEQTAPDVQIPSRDEFSSSASEVSGDTTQSEASLVPTTPDFAKMMQYGTGQSQNYNRPRYRASYGDENNSNKWIAYVGAGYSQTVADTGRHLSPNYNLQFGTGPQFGRHLAIPAEFDFNYFNIGGRDIDDESIIYFGAPHVGLGGNSHIWSFSLQPRYTFHSGNSWGAYALVGVGFYHKIANFTVPGIEYSCYYFCGAYRTNVNIDHYTSNAPGYDAGLGLTYKHLYAEARYVFIYNQQRYGVNINNYTTAPANSTDIYPANSNRTEYIPVELGVRF